MDNTTTQESQVELALQEWEVAFDLLSDTPNDYGKAAFRFGEDERIPPYESIQFAKAHFQEHGTRIGHFVKQIARAREADVKEAIRCFELIEDEEGVDAICHELGGKIAEVDPEYGVEWILGLPDSRKRYFTINRFLDGISGQTKSRSNRENSRLLEKLIDSGFLDAGQQMKAKNILDSSS